jgi:hypothetical protein
MRSCLGALALTAAASHSLTLPGAPGASSGVETFYAAQDPLTWSVGRFIKNADLSLSFDWENAQLHINVANATYVKLVANATGGMVGRFVAETDGWETTSFWVGGSAAGNTFLVASELSQTRHIRVTSVLEPAFEYASESAFLTFVGFLTDGVAVAAIQFQRDSEHAVLRARPMAAQ